MKKDLWFIFIFFTAILLVWLLQKRQERMYPETATVKAICIEEDFWNRRYKMRYVYYVNEIEYPGSTDKSYMGIP